MKRVSYLAHGPHPFMGRYRTTIVAAYRDGSLRQTRTLAWVDTIRAGGAEVLNAMMAKAMLRRLRKASLPSFGGEPVATCRASASTFGAIYKRIVHGRRTTFECLGDRADSARLAHEAADIVEQFEPFALEERAS